MRCCSAVGKIRYHERDIELWSGRHDASGFDVPIAGEPTVATKCSYSTCSHSTAWLRRKQFGILIADVEENLWRFLDWKMLAALHWQDSPSYLIPLPTLALAELLLGNTDCLAEIYSIQRLKQGHSPVKVAVVDNSRWPIAQPPPVYKATKYELLDVRNSLNIDQLCLWGRRWRVLTSSTKYIRPPCSKPHGMWRNFHHHYLARILRSHHTSIVCYSSSWDISCCSGVRWSKDDPDFAYHPGKNPSTTSSR